MKTKLFLLVVISMISGMIGNCYSQKTKISVLVIDSKTKKGIENAQVKLVSLKDSRDVTDESKNTDGKGRCSFSLEFGPSFEYNIHVQKHKYYPCYSVDPNSKQTSFRTGIQKADKDITLWLSPDSLQLLQFYSEITPHFQIDTLVNLLKEDKYSPHNRLSLPELKWEDIPRLLRIGNDAKKITGYPRNPVSSYDQKECYLGIVALWMIESIRISEGKNMLNPGGRFPSQFPRLFDKSKENDPNALPEQNSPEIMRKAYFAYLLWWKNARTIDRAAACKIDPLGNSGISW